MNSTAPVVEFTTELSADPVLTIPQEAAARLPKAGRARILILPLPADSDTDTDHSLEDALYTLYSDNPLSATEKQMVLVQAGLRAGWDDPEMDIYNDLDPRREA